MKTQPYQTYLTAQYCTENLVTDLIILNEGKEVDKEFNGKKSKALELSVQVTVKDKPVKDWTLNGTAHAALIDLFGDETKEWIGKIISIMVQKTSLGKDSIFVDKVRSKLANIPKSTG